RDQRVARLCLRHFQTGGVLLSLGGNPIRLDEPLPDRRQLALVLVDHALGLLQLRGRRGGLAHRRHVVEERLVLGLARPVLAHTGHPRMGLRPSSSFSRASFGRATMALTFSRITSSARDKPPSSARSVCNSSTPISSSRSAIPGMDASAPSSSSATKIDR